MSATLLAILLLLALPAAAQLVEPCPCLGDADKNGLVNADDLASVQENFGGPAIGPKNCGDAACIGFVNASAFAAVQANLGRSCPTTEGAPCPTPALRCNQVTPVAGQLVHCRCGP